MTYVELTKKDGFVLLTINRPEALNALNEQVLDDLDEALGMIDEDTRCLVVTGAGTKAFVAGADISVMRTQDRTEAKRFGKKGSGVFRKLEMLPIPVIAAVNGFALGGGFELALACDIRIASQNASFAFPEVTLGITPGFGGTQRIVRLVGPGAGKELLYTARRVKSEEALRLGIVNRVVPQETLLDEVFAMAASIAKNAPIAVRAAYRSVNTGVLCGMDEALAIELENYSNCYETQDQVNAMTAFVSKQEPKPFENK